MKSTRFQPSLLSLAAIAALGLPAGHALAQAAAPADAKTPVTLETVTVKASADASAGGLKAPYAGGQVARGGRVGVLGSQDIMDTPFSITNYTQKLIQDQQAASVGDVLRNDSAVRVAHGFGNFQQLYIVRGFPVYSDDMTYNGLYGLLPRQYMDTAFVERIEVLTGANAFLNGAAPGGSGLGGAINVVPKRAPNEAINEITLGVQTGGQVSAAVDIARRFGAGNSTGIRVNAIQREGDTAVKGSHQKISALSLGADFRTGGFRLSADLGYQDHQLRGTQPNTTIAAGVAIPEAPDASKSYAQPWTYSNERDTFGTLRAEYDFASNITGWAGYGFRRGNESNILANPTVTDAAGNSVAYAFSNGRVDHIATGEIGVRLKLQTGPVSHSVIASTATFNGKTNAPYVFSDFGPAFQGTLISNIYAPVANAQPVLNVFPGVTISEIQTSSVAVADTLGFMDDTLLVTLGARRQTIKNEPYDKSATTPVVGVVFKPNKIISVYGNYVEGLVQGDTAPNNGSVSNGGEVFSPFKTKQGEVGIKIDTGRFGGTFSLFTAKKPTYAAVNGVYQESYQQKNRGAELKIFGEAAPGLNLLGGASYLHTDVNGATAIGAPKTQVNLGAEWNVPYLNGLAVSATAVHTSSQFADGGNTQVVPAWTRFDLGANYAMPLGNKDLTLRLRVNNVTNRNYWASAGGYPGYGYLVSGEPRTFVLSGTVAF